MILSVGVAGGIASVLAIVFGIMVMVWKKSLNYLVGIYFILAGILGLISII